MEATKKIKEKIQEAKKPKEAKIQFISSYVTDLRNKIGVYLPYIPEDYEIENFYEIIENDAAVSHALNIVALMSAGEYYEVSSTKKELTKIILKGLSYIERFSHVRKSIVQKAMLYGLSIQKKYWKKVRWRKYPDLVWEVPVKLLEVDKRRLRIERNIEEKSDVWWTIYCPRTDSYIRIEDRNKNPFAPLATQDFLWTIYEREENSPYMKGIGEVLYPLIYMKNKAVQYWGELSEKWGQPLLVGTIKTVNALYNSASAAGSGSQDASTIMSNFLDVLENMRSRNVAVKADHDDIQIHEAGSQGQNIIHQLVDYIDNKIQLLILGAELTTMAPSVGSYALGQAHKGITGSIVSYNKNIVEEQLENDLVKDFLIRNRYNLMYLGIEFPERGEYKLTLTDKKAEQQEKIMNKLPPSHRNLKQMGV